MTNNVSTRRRRRRTTWLYSVTFTASKFLSLPVQSCTCAAWRASRPTWTARRTRSSTATPPAGGPSSQAARPWPRWCTLPCTKTGNVSVLVASFPPAPNYCTYTVCNFFFSRCWHGLPKSFCSLVEKAFTWVWLSELGRALGRGECVVNVPFIKSRLRVRKSTDSFFT